MPIYEYYCANCKTEFELIRPASKMDDPAACNKCGKPAKRQLTQFGFKSNTYSMPRFKTPMQRPLRSRDKAKAEEVGAKPRAKKSKTN